ncbi:unnamed protein product [Trypanosoma congolense IL3000]|uniref:WGS project CAEQ00000000 data, annotated contig 1488 n=1 Tax=Trypanosoma congolense (strain IL3000) TaxID=1068625 RepID=F9W6L4_TRYCI|nr:unnamed protein product [Trypanosoma congolense IL3000]
MNQWRISAAQRSANFLNNEQGATSRMPTVARKCRNTMRQMLERLHDNTVKDVRYLVGDAIITLCDWALRGASTLLAWTPRPILDEAVREARKQPLFSLASGSMSVQSSSEASDKLTRQVAGSPSTQREPGGTEDSELEGIFRKAFKSWEGACLVDFLTQK